MAALATATFEGFTVGTNVATGDDVPTNIDNVIKGAGNNITYDANSYIGSVSAKHVIPGGAFNCFYQFQLASRTQTWGRAYWYFATSTGSNDLMHELNGGWSVAVNSTARQLILRDSGAVTRATQTSTIPRNQWVRIEFFAVSNATTGSLECKIFLNPAATNPTETISFSNFNTGADTTGVHFGSASSNVITWFSDGVEINDSQYPGPITQPRFDFSDLPKQVILRR